MEEYFIIGDKKVTAEEFNNLPIEEREEWNRKAKEYHQNKLLARYKSDMILCDFFNRQKHMIKDVESTKEVVKMILKEAVGDFSKPYMIEFKIKEG